jgi:hypothetical protein
MEFPTGVEARRGAKRNEQTDTRSRGVERADGRWFIEHATGNARRLELRCWRGDSTGIG